MSWWKIDIDDLQPMKRNLTKSTFSSVLRQVCGERERGGEGERGREREREIEGEGGRERDRGRAREGERGRER